jgi:hypothetical protein
MAKASHINASKAVRGLAADLQDFYEAGQRSSASHLMQQGASAAGGAAIEAVAWTGEGLELEVAERRFALKRKAENWKLEVAERRMRLAERQMTLEQQKMTLEHSIQKQNLDLAEGQMTLEQQKMTFEHTLSHSIQNQKLDLAERLMQCMHRLDANWRADRRLLVQAKDWLCSVFL